MANIIINHFKQKNKIYIEVDSISVNLTTEKVNDIQLNQIRTRIKTFNITKIEIIKRTDNQKNNLSTGKILTICGSISSILGFLYVILN